MRVFQEVANIMLRESVKARNMKKNRSLPPITILGKFTFTFSCFKLFHNFLTVEAIFFVYLFIIYYLCPLSISITVVKRPHVPAFRGLDPL